MPFEQFDKKIREAAEHHHPAYDTQAWSKMEKLLNKHLPQETNKRRFLFIVLLFTLGLGGAGLLFLQSRKTVNKILTGYSFSIVPEKLYDQKQGPVEKEIPVVPVKPVSISNEMKDNPTGSVHTGMRNKPGRLLVSTIQSTAEKQNTRATHNRINDQKSVLKEDSRTSQQHTAVINNPNEVKERSENKWQENPVHTDGVADPIKTGITSNSTAPVKEKPADIIGNSPAIEPHSNSVAELPRKKKKTQKTHTLLLHAGGGPDISFIRLDNPGTTKLFGGGGLGYIYNNRISFRTGFYSARKIYEAKGGDYKAPPNFYTYYPYLLSVDADCRVYEIPVSLGYHFLRNSQRQFFISAGVSSYFMKNETYKYFYKYSPTGPTLNRSRTLRDVNKHYFAGLTLSGGYTRKISRHLSLTAEPYIKLPLKGIGYGKVDLNSSGILLSLGFQPFAPRPVKTNRNEK